MSGAQERFDRALNAMAAADGPEYDIDSKADALRLARDGDRYSWLELPEHVRDYWRDIAARSSDVQDTTEAKDGG